MDWKLELVVVPVTDVDRARRFYSEQVGFAVDHDTRVDDRMRVVQLTPPGSSCSIVFGTGLGEISETAPGTLRGLHLVVDDIEKARDELRGRGVDVEEVNDVGGGVRFARFTDPDGNSLLLQQMDWRTGDRF